MKFHRKFPKRIKLGVIASPPKMYPNNLIRRYSKTRLFDEIFISFLMDVLGFELEIVESTDKKFGEMKGGNWTGIIGMVQREEIDFSLATLAITDERVTAVDFSYPYMYIPVTFITDKPSYASDSNAVFKPFSIFVWGTVFISIAVVFLVLYVSKNARNHSCSMLSTYGVLLEKSIKLKVKKRSIKLLMMFWIIGTMFITWAYKAVLLSFLTVPVLTGVQDIAQLSLASENPSFKCSTFKATNDYHILNTAEDQSWNKIAHCLNRSNMFTVDIQAFLRPNNYKKAFITIRNFLVPFQKNYFLSEDIFYINILASPIRKTFCCKETLDEIIHRATAAGLLNKFRLDEEFLMTLAVKDLKTEDSDLKGKLSLHELCGAFMVLVFGHFLACTVFALEVILGKNITTNS